MYYTDQFSFKNSDLFYMKDWQQQQFSQTYERTGKDDVNAINDLPSPSIVFRSKSAWSA